MGKEPERYIGFQAYKDSQISVLHIAQEYD